MTDPMPTTTTTSPLSDEELIPGLRAGDEATLQVLIDRYWARAYRVALHLAGGDPGAAEDVAQETFVEVLRAVDRFQDGRRVRPWFFRLLSNTAADRRRAGGRRRRHEAAGTARADLRVVDAVAEASKEEAARLVREGLERLDEPLRAALTLRYLEGLSLAEVAETLEIPEGTVSSRVRRGLESLRELTPALASLGVAGIAVALEQALPGPVPGAPAAAEIAAARAVPPPVPPPAPEAARVAAGAGKRAIPTAAAALCVGALGLAAAALLLDPSPPSGAPTASRPPTPTTAPVAAGGAGSPSGEGAPGQPLALTAGGASPTESVVARVASASALQATWIAALPSGAKTLEDLDGGEYARDNEQAARVGRLLGGWSIPETAARVERADGQVGLDLPPGRHLVAVGARGCSTQVQAVTVPASGRVELPVDLGAAVVPAVLQLSLRDHRGRPLRWEVLRLGLRPEGVQPLVVRKDLPPPPVAKDPVMQAFLDGLRAGLENLTSMLVLDPVTTDGEGRVRLELAPGTWSVAGSSHGGVQPVGFDTPQRGVTVTLAAGQTQELTLVTHRLEGASADLLVRVVDRDGRPVPHARFVLVTSENRGLPHRYNRPIEDELRAGERDPFGEQRTGPDGARLIRGVPLGSAAVIAREGARGGRSAIVQLERPGDELPLEVVLDQDLAVADLTLTVLDDETGRPVQDRLSLRLEWEGQRSSSMTVTPDDRGVVRLQDLRPGRATLRAQGPHHVPCERLSVDLGRGAVREVVLRLSRGQVIAGRVVAADGGAVQGRLEVRLPGDRAYRADVELAADGAFRLGGLPAGAVAEVTVTNVDGHLDQRFPRVAPGEGLRLELDGRLAAEVTVKDDAGAPIASAVVTLSGYEPGGGVRVEARLHTDAEGRAVVRGSLPAENAHLNVEGPREGVDETHERAHVALGNDAQAPVRQTVTLRRRPTEESAWGVLAGRVVDAQGAPVEGARVDVESRHSSIGLASTDARGRFEGRARPGRVTVLAHQGRLHGSATVAVAAEGRAEVEVVLAPWVMVAGRVRGAGERRLDVLARPADDEDAVESVEVEGAGADAPFSFGYLAPGRWRLVVRDDQTLREVAEVELDLRDGVDRTDLVIEVPPG